MTFGLSNYYDKLWALEKAFIINKNCNEFTIILKEVLNKFIKSSKEAHKKFMRSYKEFARNSHEAYLKFIRGFVQHSQEVCPKFIIRLFKIFNKFIQNS